MLNAETVALLAEGVDRNANDTLTINIPAGSPSSRRAWIEICSHGQGEAAGTVALLAEGVDRNSQNGDWDKRSGQVALLAEGVDRNLKKLW